MMVTAAENLPLGILMVRNPTAENFAELPCSHILRLECSIRNIPSSVRNMQIVFSLRKGAPDVMGMISLATSWAQLGSSLGKVVLLKDLLPYRNKQVESCLPPCMLWPADENQSRYVK